MTTPEITEEIITTEKSKFIRKWERNYGYFQFGLQRTGTTFIDFTFKRNFNIWKANDLIHHDKNNRPPSPETLTWKHSIWVPKNYRQGWPVILNYKNPYTWVESMLYRRGLENSGWGSTYSGLLPILDRRSDTYEKHKSDWIYNTDSFVQVYRYWFNTWLDFYEKNKDITYIIKYEDLLYEDKREDIFNKAADKFGWDKPKEYYWVPHVGASQPIENRVEYYKNGVPEKLERKYIDLVNEFFDKDLMDRLGYTVL